MASFQIRFNLTAAGAPSRQNPARCVAVSAASPAQAMARLAAHYAKSGRSPRIYAILIDGLWRRVELRSFVDVSPFSRHFDFGGQATEILSPLGDLAPMPVERPAWATGAPPPPLGGKLARIERLVSDLAPTQSGPEAARILEGLRTTLAADPAHRLEGRFKKLKALAKAEGLWNRED